VLEHSGSALFWLWRALGSLGGKDAVALEKVAEDDSGRVALAADTDAFKDTVTVELVEDEVSVEDASGLELVGDDTTDEMGRGGVQGLHQLVELLSVTG